MQLSVKGKVIVLMCSILVVIFGALALVNSYLQSNSMTELYGTNATALNWTLSHQVEEFMVNGDNEKLQPLTEELVAKGLVKELTIIDAEKKIARSSRKELLNTTASDPEWRSLFATQKDSIDSRTVDGEPVMVSFKVIERKEVCEQCHDKAGSPVLGGLKIVSSEAAMANAIHKGFLASIIMSVLGALALVGVMTWTLTRNVFTPLRSVKAKLERATEGDIDQQLKIRSQDEIGSFLKVTQKLIDYIKGFAGASTEIADGNLQVTVEPRSSQDQLGHAYRKMISNLEGIVGQLSAIAERLVSASHRISNTSEKLNSSAQVQVDSVQQVSSAVEEMAATSIETTHNTSHATELSQTASQTAVQGAAIVEEAISGMHRIAAQVEESAQSMSQLSSSASQITDIVEVISDIADQTNLLALNAAIEAARAGEQGRGFAVVADEVRKLAEKTVRATAQIGEMVKQIQQQTGAASTSMESCVVLVQTGTSAADKAGRSLKEIVALVEQVSRMIQQIARASSEQSTTAEDITKNIAQFSALTHDTANSAQESQEASDQLKEQAEGLLGIVRRFKVKQ